MLIIEDLHVFYGSVHAVKGVSLKIEKGETVALLGANGAGKSTIIRSITGLLKVTKGSVSFEGKALNKIPSHKVVKLGIACVPEGRELFSKLTVMENLRMGAFTQNDVKKINESIEEVYELFPRVAERKNQLAGTLSGGEQQMVAIGRALMSQPKLLLLDEPSLGLAPIVIDSVFDVLKTLKDKGTTIFLVEQNANLALNFADRGYIMETGVIKLSGNAKELISNPDVKKAYLGG